MQFDEQYQVNNYSFSITPTLGRNCKITYSALSWIFIYVYEYKEILNQYFFIF
ncbi:hypothetical protein NIES267_12500 [Calothrix parasitica NIES-267]|uniref:Uncharacterized protein n=1 Tax=Calothrix parasitica NIES-267 TaxID=1973488 RepID=A0A1Z4LKK3_9CYAN|nr:hypothetical protein NIES267_12500 [Calothrix parasitica NIES-267]